MSLPECRASTDCSRRFDLIESRLAHVEREQRDQSDRWEEIRKSVTDLKVGLASLNGRLAGYLVAASLLGTVVAFIAQRVLGSE